MRPPRAAAAAAAAALPHPRCARRCGCGRARGGHVRRWHARRQRTHHQGAHRKFRAVFCGLPAANESCCSSACLCPEACTRSTCTSAAMSRCVLCCAAGCARRCSASRCPSGEEFAGLCQTCRALPPHCRPPPPPPRYTSPSATCCFVLCSCSASILRRRPQALTSCHASLHSVTRHAAGVDRSLERAAGVHRRQRSCPGCGLLRPRVQRKRE